MNPTALTQAVGAGDPLAALRDIHLPDPIPFWPPAPGWYLAAGLLLAVVALAAWRLHRRRIGLARAARVELARLAAGFRQDEDVLALAGGLAALLRRVSLARFRRVEVAALHGPEWHDFLARTGRLTPTTAEALATAVYAPPRHTEVTDAERWIADVRDWIRRVA